MDKIIQPLCVILLFVLVRAGDVAIGAASTRDIMRAVVYGLVAVLALIALILSLGVR